MSPFKGVMNHTLKDGVEFRRENAWKERAKERRHEDQKTQKKQERRESDRA